MMNHIRSAKLLLLGYSCLLSGCSTSTDTASAQAPTGAPQPGAGTLSRTVSLRDLIGQGLEFNLDIKSARLEPLIAAQEVRKERAAFEPALQAATGTAYTKRPLNTRELLATGLPGTAGRDFNDGTADYSLGIVGKLSAGTQYDLSFKGNRYRNDLNENSLTSPFYPEYDSFAGLTLTQPLFRGAGVAVNMAPVNIAKASERIAVIQRSRKAEEIALDISIRYCDLSFAVGEIKVRTEAVRLAAALAADHQRRLEQGVGSNVEILEAQSAAASRTDELEVSVTRLLEVQAELCKLIGASNDASPDTMVPSSTGFLFDPPSDRAGLISSALRNRLDYRQARIGIEKQHIQIRYAQNQQWPQLDLKASCGVLGLDSSVGRAVARASSGNNPFWSVGLTLTIPLGGSEADSQVKAANLKNAQALMELQKIEQGIVIDIDSQLRILQVHRRRITSARAALELSRQRLDAEGQKMEKGTTTGFAMLEAQKDLTAARTQELSAIADFNRSAAKLAYQKGTLLQDVGFHVTE
ncbi:MAG: TolC family protein [Verrucomicrobia bacterium]|nr:TolC family protein [Verrucomicrobiota bacterium]